MMYTEPDGGWHRDQETKLAAMRALVRLLPPVIQRMVTERIDQYARLVSDLVGGPRPGSCHDTAEVLIDELYDEVVIVSAALSRQS